MTSSDGAKCQQLRKAASRLSQCARTQKAEDCTPGLSEVASNDERVAGMFLFWKSFPRQRLLLERPRKNTGEKVFQVARSCYYFPCPVFLERTVHSADNTSAACHKSRLALAPFLYFITPIILTHRKRQLVHYES